MGIPPNGWTQYRIEAAKTDALRAEIERLRAELAAEKADAELVARKAGNAVRDEAIRRLSSYDASKCAQIVAGIDVNAIVDAAMKDNAGCS